MRWWDCKGVATNGLLAALGSMAPRSLARRTITCNAYFLLLLFYSCFCFIVQAHLTFGRPESRWWHKARLVVPRSFWRC
jgi:hypothetical protein